MTRSAIVFGVIENQIRQAETHDRDGDGRRAWPSGGWGRFTVSDVGDPDLESRGSTSILGRPLDGTLSSEERSREA